MIEINTKSSNANASRQKKQGLLGFVMWNVVIPSALGLTLALMFGGF